MSNPPHPQDNPSRRDVNCGAPLHNLHLRGRRSNRGQELVEFAFLVPLLLIIAFGVLDLGRLFHAAIVLTAAAREGARYGSLYGVDRLNGFALKTAEIKAQTRDEAAGSSIDIPLGDIDVVCPSGCGTGKPLRVTVSYQFQLVLAGLLPNPNLTLVRRAEMMIP